MMEHRIVRLPSWAFYAISAASVWLSPISFVVNLILELLGVLV